MLRRATFRIAAMLGPWLCACSLGCQGVPARDSAESGPSFTQASETAGPNGGGSAPGTGAPIQTVSYSPTESVGRAAVLGNPRIGPNSEISWSIKDLPVSAGVVVGGRGIVNRDGRLDLNGYGTILVAGLTPAEATVAIEEHVQRVVAQGGKPMDTPPIPVVTRAPTPVEKPVLAPVPPRREPVVNAKPSPAATDPPNKAGWGPVAGKGRTEPPMAAPPKKTELASARPKIDPALRPVAYQTPSAPPPPSGPPLGPPPPDAAPAGDTLPAPRAVANQEHLTPVPVDPSMLTGCAGGDGNAAVPRELAMASLPPYVLDPPDVLAVESTQGLRDQPIRGQHLIRPDGTISLGIYGSVHVAGLTIEQARMAIAQVLALRIKDFDPRNLSVDVLSYNSKVYYVITDGGGYGEQVYRVPVTGSETVLDAISQINGLPPVASKRRIWLARRTLGEGGPGQTYPVDWRAITQQGLSATNYQVLPGDRIYVKADCLMAIDAALAKFLSPVQRILGTTLLGGATVNTIGGSGSGAGLGTSAIGR